ncbi:hypothetical protein UFOVP116_259 [uncultured Caudovirales phage]|uniref:Uncharacterized protein n=1 Tax=uncultured Caudovirales phage TaxID=2100421 RepID=A0A6J5LEL0_9CAUD|nr:hypothetical protein UFOVP116_259 [uncultured Caudovirales phage]
MKKFFKKLTGIDKLEELAAKGASVLAAERAAEEEAARIIAAQAAEAALTPKERASKAGEPYVNIDRVSIDPKQPGQGAFELDWNEFFIAQLVRSGYKGTNDELIVDQWFADVCRNVVLETYEQYEANNTERIQRKDLGNGRSEFS